MFQSIAIVILVLKAGDAGAAGPSRPAGSEQRQPPTEVTLYSPSV